VAIIGISMMIGQTIEKRQDPEPVDYLLWGGFPSRDRRGIIYTDPETGLKYRAVIIGSAPIADVPIWGKVGGSFGGYTVHAPNGRIYSNYDLGVALAKAKAAQRPQPKGAAPVG
jgi:hypothetical protein